MVRILVPKHFQDGATLTGLIGFDENKSTLVQKLLELLETG